MAKRSIVNRHTKGEFIVYVIVFVLFVIYAVGLIYPYLYGLNASLKVNGRAFMENPVSIAWPPEFSNYLTAFEELVVADNSYFMMTFNSIWYSIVGAAITLLTSSMSTYCVCKYTFRGRNFIYNLVIFMMILPIVGAGPSAYRLYTQLGITQSPLILVTCLGGLCDLIIFAYMKNIPWEYAEAAFIDGAGHFSVFFRIMLPQALPALSVLFATNVIGRWNDYSTPILYLNESYPTLASGLYLYEQRIVYMANQPIYFAGAILAMLPPLILFIAMQNSIMSKVYLGGLKG